MAAVDEKSESFIEQGLIISFGDDFGPSFLIGEFELRVRIKFKQLAWVEKYSLGDGKFEATRNSLKLLVVDFLFLSSCCAHNLYYFN